MSGRSQRSPRARLVVAVAVVCFGAGVAATELAHRSAGTAAPAPTAPSGAPSDGAVVLVPAPKVVFDPESIELLPDASLRLALPPGFDAGTR